MILFFDHPNLWGLPGTKNLFPCPRSIGVLTHHETLPYRGPRASSALVTWVPRAIWWELTLVLEFPTQLAYFLKPRVMMVVEVSLDPIFMPLKWSAMSLVRRMPTYRWKTTLEVAKSLSPLTHSWWECKWFNHLGEKFGRFLQNKQLPILLLSNW